MAGKRKPAESRNADTPFLEWLLGGIGVVLVAACVGFLIYEGVKNGEEQPGAISASVKDIAGVDGAYIVTFELHNAGTQTLSNFHVTARLIEGDREVEQVQAVLDYLPGRSHQEGGFYFKNDPHQFRLEITPEGFQKP
jgi:uncharacterized protein (TIGR02588 family)